MAFGNETALELESEKYCSDEAHLEVKFADPSCRQGGRSTMTNPEMRTF
jgi:hypothetical protein